MADEIIGEQVDIEVLSDHLRCFRRQEIHLHRCFEMSNIQLRVPSVPIQLSKCLFGIGFGVESGRHQRHIFSSESPTLDIEPNFPHEQLRWEQVELFF